MRPFLAPLPLLLGGALLLACPAPSPDQTPDASTPVPDGGGGDEVPEWRMTLHADAPDTWSGVNLLLDGEPMHQPDDPASPWREALFDATFELDEAGSDGANAGGRLDLVISERSFVVTGRASMSAPATSAGAAANASLRDARLCLEARGASRFRVTVACTGEVSSNVDGAASITASWGDHQFCSLGSVSGASSGWIAGDGASITVDAVNGTHCPAAGELSIAFLASGGALPEDPASAFSEGRVTVTVEPLQ